MPSELFKLHKLKLSIIGRKLSTKTKLGGEWGKGMIALIHKRRKNDLNNYRPIVLLNTICKIWETIISTRLNPITNLLANDFQCAYKKIDHR